VTLLRNFLRLWKNIFGSADKSLAGTLMSELTNMKFDGTRVPCMSMFLEMSNLAAKAQWLLGMNADESFFVQSYFEFLAF
jgi:hypothetical protein